MPIAKKYKAAIALFDREAQYTPTEAAELIKKTASAKFDESIDLAIRLGVDPRKADQAVRGTVALPAGSGKTLRIAVFAAGDAANEARAAGADLVGADDLAAEIEKGNMDFDLAIATPDMMPLVGRLGRVLGPRGLMPNPRPEQLLTTLVVLLQSSWAEKLNTAQTVTAMCTFALVRLRSALLTSS